MVQLQRMMGEMDHTIVGRFQAIQGRRTVLWLRKYQLEDAKLRFLPLASCELLNFFDSVFLFVKWDHNNIYFPGRDITCKTVL